MVLNVALQFEQQLALKPSAFDQMKTVEAAAAMKAAQAHEEEMGRYHVAVAAEAMNTGRRYTAPDAVAAGLVEHTAADADVVALAVELAAPYAAKDRSVVAAHKQMLFADVARTCGHEV